MNNSDRLYKLLPEIYRLRDTAEGEPLKALLALFEKELLTIEGDISDLYDNWFIETCAEWAVPYIGDLLDVPEFYTDRSLVYGQQERRAYVANTIAYRRRKGTAPVLEQLTQDVTGWRSRAVEFARLVATTQNLNHLRSNSTTANLRTNNQLQQIGTPFEQQAAYTADIRPVSQKGCYNVANIGLFIYRLQSYPSDRTTARAVPGSEANITGRCYTFNSLGKDAPLFNQPRTKTDILSLAEEINLPGILRRAVLANELKQRRQPYLQGKSLAEIRYFDRDPVLQIFVNGQPNSIPPEEILICSLDETEDKLWNIPTQEFEPNNDDLPLPAIVAVDPELGRIAFLDKPLPKRVEVSYFYGFSDDLGGGSYSRSNASRNDLIPSDLSNKEINPPLFWEIKQGNSGDANPLATAIENWNQTVEAWHGLKEFTHIPLASILIPSVRVIHLDREKTRPLFRPGIIGEGLRVIVRSGSLSVIVTPGRAVDRQGRLIVIKKEYLVNLEKFNLAQDARGWLVIFYRSSSDQVAEDQPPIKFVSESAFDQYPPGTFIPLIYLTLNSQGKNAQFDESICRSFQFESGIVQGLEVKLQPGKLEAVITVGTVVDERGRSLIIPNNFSVDLSLYQGETKQIVLNQAIGWKKQWQIELLNQEDYQNNCDKNCFSLATLKIPQIKISKIENSPSYTHLPSNKIGNEDNLDEIKINGLNVLLVNIERAIIAIAPGTVSNQGQTISLEREIQFDLSAYSGQTLTLFISYKTKQGLPLSPVSLKGRGWQHLGIVPQEPEEAETGTILITDNCTYEGELSIIVPAQRRLEIIAADGCRPHLQGNVSVRGTAAEDAHPGELTLYGLLVEGNITVLAGNLKRLNINHCTLVPQHGGVSVEPGWLIPPDHSSGEEFDAIALVMYSLNWVWQSICRDIGLSNACSEFNPTQLLPPAFGQLPNRVSQIWQTIQRWRCPQELEPHTEDAPTTTQWNNARLEIAINRSICGRLYLSDTVAKLTIADSIIDIGLTEQEQQPEAISALGSEVEIKTTTVLGMTTARNLQASNSIFTEKVMVRRHQSGYIRFSYVPEASHTPRRYECQPDMALKAALTKIPTAVTAIEILPSNVFLGTAGDGVFRLNINSENNESQREKAAQSLPNCYITTLLFYLQPGNSTPSKINTLWAGAVDGSIYYSRNDGENWTNIKTKVDTAINHLVAWVRQGRGTISSEGSKLIGKGTFFSSEVRTGDTISIKGETRIVTALGEAGIGTISSQGIIVTGHNTNFTAIQVGDRITALDQTRIIVKIYTTNSQQDCLEVNAPFSQDLPEKTTFTIKIDTLLQLNSPLPSDVKEPHFKIRHLLAATLGDGILRANDRGENWEKINTGLTNLNVTALAIDSTGQLFAGTSGGGVFKYTINDNQSETESHHWIPFNIGLSNLSITSLAIDAKDQLWAGTAGSGIFYSTLNGKSWTEINQGLTSFVITALVTLQITKGASKGNIIVFAGTTNGQVFRLFTKQEKWQKLQLDLKGIDITTLTTNANKQAILAGTASGDILQFTNKDKDENWISLNQGLPNVAEKLLIMERLQPSFTSTNYGDPGYIQLRQSCSQEICTGAEDGAEMGAFNFLKQPQREANLQASLKEYLRFGLQAKTFYIN